MPPPPIVNGPVTMSICLACALRYFAGGSLYNIMNVYGVSHTIILDSVWCVVEQSISCLSSTSNTPVIIGIEEDS